MVGGGRPPLPEISGQPGAKSPILNRYSLGNMPRVSWVVSCGLCSRFHMLSRSMKILKIG